MGEREGKEEGRGKHGVTKEVEMERKSGTPEGKKDKQQEERLGRGSFTLLFLPFLCCSSCCW